MTALSISQPRLTSTQQALLMYEYGADDAYPTEEQYKATLAARARKYRQAAKEKKYAERADKYKVEYERLLAKQQLAQATRETKATRAQEKDRLRAAKETEKEEYRATHFSSLEQKKIDAAHHIYRTKKKLLLSTKTTEVSRAGVRVQGVVDILRAKYSQSPTEENGRALSKAKYARAELWAREKQLRGYI